MLEPTKEPLADVSAETPTESDAPVPADELVEQDLLIEDVSIDGMCGVY